jgi:hypothetical protein
VYDSTYSRRIAVAGASLAAGVGINDRTSPCHHGVELGTPGGFRKEH